MAHGEWLDYRELKPVPTAVSVIHDLMDLLTIALGAYHHVVDSGNGSTQLQYSFRNNEYKKKIFLPLQLPPSAPLPVKVLRLTLLVH